jgi:hypothetical protein
MLNGFAGWKSRTKKRFSTGLSDRGARYPFAHAVVGYKSGSGRGWDWVYYNLPIHGARAKKRLSAALCHVVDGGFDSSGGMSAHRLVSLSLDAGLISPSVAKEMERIAEASSVTGSEGGSEQGEEGSPAPQHHLTRTAAVGAPSARQWTGTRRTTPAATGSGSDEGAPPPEPQHTRRGPARTADAAAAAAVGPAGQRWARGPRTAPAAAGSGSDEGAPPPEPQHTRRGPARTANAAAAVGPAPDVTVAADEHALPCERPQRNARSSIRLRDFHTCSIEGVQSSSDEEAGPPGIRFRMNKHEVSWL